MDVQLIRHATLRINFANKILLIDPMFSKAGELEPTANTLNQRNNPLVELPVKPEDLINVDAIIVTHTHRDHLDPAAIQALPKDITLFCQPEDVNKITEFGFTNVVAIHKKIEWEGITIERTGGQHGTGEIGVKMGPVSGFLLFNQYEPTLYLIGDSVWCPEVETVLKNYDPDVSVVFSGAAQFIEGDPITMAKQDIEMVCKSTTKTKFIIAHMESWNHCPLTRSELKEYSLLKNFNDRIVVPNDGESMSFGTS